MRAVNLLPREHVEQKRPGERSNTVVLVSAVGGAAVVLALAAGFLLASRSVDRQRQALNTAKAVLAVTPAHTSSARTAAFHSTLLSAREQRSLALAAALGKRVAWDRILRRIALVMPDDVWLTNLKGSVPLASAVATPGAPAPAVGTPAGPFPATPTALTMIGYTYTQAGVARLLERLQVLPDLKNVQLQNSEVSSINQQRVINFTIVSDIRKGKGAS